jgi:IS1 family transposase
MPEERRQNDIIILEEIRELQKNVNKIDVNLALNTHETGRLAKYQELMNGRVASHESRLQTIEGANALTATALAEIKTAKQKQSDTRSMILSRAGWAIAGGGLVLMGRILTYLIQNDFIKEIIK